MDKYEVEFREKIKLAAKGIVVDRLELGQLRLKRLAALLYILIKEKGEKFDLIASGGNSGTFVQEIVKMIYRNAGVELPPMVLFPIYRPSNEEGVTISKDVVEEQLKGLKNIRKILFVDDEIMRGQTAKACFETIRDYFRDKNENFFLNCTIVAENHNFIWSYDLKNISVRYLPFAFVLQGYNCNFGYLMPEETVKMMEQITGEPIDRNQAMALLLGGRKKVEKEKVASFVSEKDLDLNNKIPNYNQMKTEINKIFEDLVIAGIREYKNGEIEFRYLP